MDSTKKSGHIKKIIWLTLTLVGRNMFCLLTLLTCLYFFIQIFPWSCWLNMTTNFKLTHLTGIGMILRSLCDCASSFLKTFKHHLNF